MQVVLTRDVKGLGCAHEAVEAKDGYALNYLIPKKLAVPATPAALKEGQARRKQWEERRALDAKLLAEALAALADGRVQITMKANEQGRLYEAVAAPEIAAAVEAQTRLVILESAIKLEHPIKELGSYRVPVASGETFGEIAVDVVAE